MDQRTTIMASTTVSEAEDARKEQERRESYTKEQWGEDVRFLLENPQGRRLIRFMLGPQCTNLLGINSEGRVAGVALVNELRIEEPRAMNVLFTTQEDDEHGWT